MTRDERIKATSAAIGEVVRGTRRLRGMRTHELAKNAGISCGTLRAIENGERKPRADHLVAIATAMNITVLEIVAEAVIPICKTPLALGITHHGAVLNEAEATGIAI